jgi:hypothetical protein
MKLFEREPAENARSEIFVPKYFYEGCELEIFVSLGRWNMFRPGQVLQWWHSGSEDQILKISLVYKRDVIGTTEGDADGWFYDWYTKCSIM